MGSLDGPAERVLVYLREAAELGAPLDDEFVATFGDDVAAAFSLLHRRAEESDADVVLRSSQHPLAREVVANDVGEELDRLASAGGGIGAGPRWDFLILCQALLDRVASADDDSADPEPLVLESADRVATVYLHPVHGDIVILVRPLAEGDGAEQWVLIDKAHKNEILLALVAQRLAEPLEAGLVPWLQSRGIRHHVYGSDEMGAGGTALA